MIERLIILENVDPVVFFGINNSNIQLLKTLYPKLRIVARGNVIKVIGEEEELAAFEEAIHELEKFSIEMNILKEEDIIDIVKGKAPAVVKVDNLIIHGMSGKPILARTPNQKRLVEEFDKNDMVFAIGRRDRARPIPPSHWPWAPQAQEHPQDHPKPTGRGSRRKAGVPTRGYERENRPLPATAIRCVGGYDSPDEAEGVLREQRYPTRCWRLCGDAP